MTVLHLIFIAAIQGLTEFLPISSSAHLILVPHVLGEADQGLVIDLAAHIGTLLAVLIYFRRDVIKLSLATVSKSSPANEKRLALGVILATIPVCVAGFLLKDLIEGEFRSPLIIAGASIFFGALLWLADKVPARIKNIESLGISNAISIGVAQTLALIPGTSRSGVTMTMARYLGFDRDVAARFSFLLSIPTTAGAASLALADAIEETVPIGPDFWIVAALSFVFGYISIHFLLKWLQRFSFNVFVYYRIALGLLILGFYL